MEGVPEFIFEGVKVSHDIPYISAIKATKLMRQGCQEFLASVLDNSRTDIKIETIPVVNEFPDVFPEDLLGLAPRSGCRICNRCDARYCPNFKGTISYGSCRNEGT